MAGRGRTWLMALLGLGALAGRSAAQGADTDSAVAACERADTSTAWRRARQVWLGANAGRRAQDDALRRRLLALADSDQAVRHFMSVPDSMANTAAIRRMALQDSTDGVALRAIVARYGWPTVRLVGRDGAEAAFTLAQHGDDALLNQALRLMLALPSTEVLPTNLALLQDRVLRHAGKPQRYGSQLSRNPDGTWSFEPMEDPAHVDERRARMALPPLHVYACMVRAMYHAEVNEPR